ncbi:uncharacterized protein [Palaemon carinicauda]|uniref:uncharacterized protein n=1 Tax=Palaemon carinicauda TaxID=392227 RepID=UPI0035B61B37
MAPTEKPIRPQDLITEEHIKEVLKADKGSDALLRSWKVVDFTKPGDNYVCVVTSVEVTYSLCNKEKCRINYVVKLSAHKVIEGFPDLTSIFFTKESKFYQEIVPALNGELVLAGQEILHIPKCLYISLENGKEQIYFEDLRARDFKMFDRRKGMDKDHIDLVMAELARLHSASYLLMNKYHEGKTAATEYEFLAKDWLTFTPTAKKVFLPMFQSNIDNGVKMLEKMGGYETAIGWMKSLKDEVEDVVTVQMQSKRFNSICHGDFWNNNTLFRYNDEGQPTDVMLLDLQLCREASLATDLNYFFYTSVTGDIRRPNIDHFLSTYHSSYKKVVEGGNLPMHFNKEELLQEFRDKNKVGLMFAMMVLPAVLMEPEEVSDFADRDVAELMRDFRERMLDKPDSNSLFKPRFLSMFDEFMETGLIS